MRGWLESQLAWLKATPPLLALIIGIIVAWGGWVAHLYGRELQYRADRATLRTMQNEQRELSREIDFLQRKCNPKMKELS